MSLTHAKSILQQGNDEVNEYSSGFFDFEQTRHVLNKANRLMVSRQQAILEEQRFHLLFQILSIAFHELNQPLTSLLGNIELLGFTRKNPEKLEGSLNRIEEAGRRLSKTIKEIQRIRNEVSAPRVNLLRARPIPRETFHVLVLVESDSEFEQIHAALKGVPALVLFHVKSRDLAAAVMNEKPVRLAIIDDLFLSASGADFIKDMFQGIPVVALSGNSSDRLLLEALEEGVEDFIDKTRITGPSLLGVMHHAIATAEMKNLLGSTLDQLADISPRDSATGLFQGRYFKDAVEREMVKADRSGTSFFICKLRINEFNKIHSLLDSGAADLLLRDISKLIERKCKSICVCRQETNALAFIAPGRLDAAAQNLCINLEATFTQYLKSRLPSSVCAHADVKIAWYTPLTWCSCNELIQQVA